MIGVVTNELERAKYVLSLPNSKDGIGNNVRLMVKYYYIIEEITDKQELKEKIFILLSKKHAGYKRGRWEVSITKCVEAFLKSAKYKKIDKTTEEMLEFFPNKEFFQIDKIEITDNELRDISLLADKKLEKLSFIMLVYAKITNKTLREDLNWSGKSMTDVLKEAKIGLQGRAKAQLFGKLYHTKLKEERIADENGEYTIEEINYVSMPKSNTKNSFKINYADTINEESKIGITITDFKSVIYYYLIWKGEKWKQCIHIKEDGKVCKKWFKATNNSGKYCNPCAKNSKYKKVALMNKRKREEISNEE